MRTAPRFARGGKTTVRPALWFCACNLMAAVLAAQCSNPTQVPNQTISSGTANYSDNNALAASSVVINGSASVTFLAGNCIDLQPGFHATAGTAATTFHAWIGASVPSITSLSVTSGTVGTPVTITGNNFGSSQSSSTVKFNGTTASVTYWGATSVGVTVPAGATSGNVVVTVNGQASNGVSFSVTMPVATPTFSPGAGTYASGQTVTIGTTTSGATIRYTTDGSTPSETAGAVYSGPVAVNSSETLQAMAYKSGWLDSAVATAVYTLNLPPPPAVTLTAPANGAVNQPTALTLTWAAASGATSYDVYLGPGTPTFAGNTTNTSYTPGAALAGSTIYSWYVVAKNASGGGPASPTWTFTTLAASLTIASAHSGMFTQGQSNATYTLTVANGASAGATAGPVEVTEIVPSGLIPVGMQGAGWTCAGPNCARSDALAPGSSYPAIALTVGVASHAPASVTNTATVSGGGSANASASDPTTIDALPVYSIPLAFAVPASVVAGAPTTFTVTYASQAGSGDIAGGQVQIDSCYLGWDSSGNITLYYNPNQAYVSGMLGQNATLWAGSCSINLANSTLSPVTGNPDELALSLAITFPEQNWQSTDFFGTHEVYGWGTNAEGLETAAVDLGAMVVSPGQDYTLTVSPSGTTTVPYMGTVTLTVTATGLNGFTGLVNLQIGLAPGWTNPCFSLWGSIPYLTANSQGSFTLQNTCPNGSWWTEFVITGNAPSIGVNRTGSSNPFLNATAGADFTITPGLPTPPNLPAQGSIQYPVTVTSIGNQSGYVNLTLAPPAGSSMPAGVTYQFAPAQVYLSGGGSGQSTLTLSSTASTPGGASPLVITGTLQATGAQRTAAFSLGTQVTTFQVTSVTGSAIVHNSGQEVQVTQTVPASDAPSYSTCDSADPDVTCRVISAAPGAVTLGITASKSAAHGTRVVRVNGGAGKAHALIADAPPEGFEVTIDPPDVTAGDFGVQTTVTLNGFCDAVEDCDPGEVMLVDRLGIEANWAYFPPVPYGEVISGTLSPPLDAAGDYGVTGDFCFDFYNPVEEWIGCKIGLATLTVLAPPPPAITININNTADTSDDITVLNPAQTIPAQVVMNGASGTVTLSVTPSGRASFDQPSFYLLDGVPATVAITPLQQSSAPNDVKITASYNGTGLGQASMTIVDVVIPNIRNVDTPDGMPDRIPPTATTPIQVTVAPDLTNSGQKVTLATLNTSAANGDFTVSGAATFDLMKTTNVNLVGTLQTAATGTFGWACPEGVVGGGNKGQLRLVAKVRGAIAVRSPGFSVAAIPLNWTSTLVGPIPGGVYYGMRVLDGWYSDSGSIVDLFQTCLSEKVQVVSPTGMFEYVAPPTTSGYFIATGFTTDDFGTPIGIITGPGSEVTNQVHTIRDYRLGVTDIPMTDSGFAITREVTQDAGGLHFAVTRTGAAVTVTPDVNFPSNTFSSTAGTCTPTVLTLVQP